MIKISDDILIGYFIITIYHNNSYMVAKFKTEDDTVVLTGPFFDYDKKQKYQVKGSYVEHYRYGLQFNYTAIDVVIPDNKEAIINLLTSPTFPLIGNKTANKIYDYFQDETINILKDNPHKILEVKLTNKQTESILNGFASLQDPENEIRFYLLSNGFNNLDVFKILNHFKLTTLDIINENPFKLYLDIYAINFDKVKNLAQKINFENSDLKFEEAYLIYLFKKYTFNTGDLFIDKDTLYHLLKTNNFTNNFDDIINMCIDDNYLVDDHENYYLFNDYHDENYIVSYFKNFTNHLDVDKVLVTEQISELENVFSITYNDVQKEAIKDFFMNDFTLITGGPGTGKTTIVKAMAKIFHNLLPFSNLVLLAPTGRTAKRMSEVCDIEARTIHSILKWDKETNIFAHDLENPIMYDCLIIDEFSMVDNFLFASLLKASANIKKICIIGDPEQLPSIRSGDLLNDFLHSDIFKIKCLNFNYRQEKQSEIILLANDIINNNFDINSYCNDVKFYDLEFEQIDLISMIKENINSGYELDDIQVLAPMYKGEWGIDSINLMLQKAFNNDSKTIKYKSNSKYQFKENDKVIQLKNRPTDDVYNGDIGYIEEIDNDEKYVMVNFQGTIVFYKFEELDELSLAYAISVHKAQGSEYPIVYFISNRNNYHMLYKKLIYTAITRTKKSLYIISYSNLLNIGVTKELKKRNTSLVYKINN